MHYSEIAIARAIACIGVVILHAGFPIFEVNKILSITFSELFRFSTPLYVAISGFLITKSSQIKEGSFISFIGKKAKYLVPPFLFWGVIYLAEYIVFYGGNINIGYEKVANILLLGQSKGHLYFVPLIIQLYIIYYFIKRYNLLNSINGLCVGIFLTFVWYLSFDQLTLIIGDPRLFFPSIIFSFAIGYYLGENNEVFKKPSFNLLFVASFMAVCGLSSLIVGSIIGQTIMPTWHVFSLVYGGSMIFLILFACSKVKKVPAIISKISRYSFSIYLSHWICLDILNLLLPNTLFVGVRYTVLVLGTLFLAYVIGFLGNLLPYGYYLVGRSAETLLKSTIKPSASVGRFRQVGRVKA